MQRTKHFPQVSRLSTSSPDALLHAIALAMVRRQMQEKWGRVPMTAGRSH